MSTRPVPEKFLVAFSFAGENRNVVRSIAEAVEVRLGYGQVFLDEWFEHYIAGNDADLVLQKVYLERSILVILCASAPYGNKAWPQTENTAIRALQLRLLANPDSQGRNRILPLRVGDGDVPGMYENTIWIDVRGKSVEQTAQLILDRLHLIDPQYGGNSADVPAKSLWPSTPMLEWPMADHRGARDAFEKLLTQEAPWRLLPIQGSSDTGKSHITRQMLAHALRTRDFACGHFDFKGTTGMDAELQAFVPPLGVALPPDSPRLNDRLSHILDALRQRGHPTLLLLDTYEVAGEARGWVEKQLLPSLMRAPWLRVVVAGQCVPCGPGSVWASQSSETIHLVPPSPEEWHTFAKSYKPGISLDFVRQAYECCGGRSSVLAQLLGPSS